MMTGLNQKIGNVGSVKKCLWLTTKNMRTAIVAGGANKIADSRKDTMRASWIWEQFGLARHSHAYLF